MAAGLVPHAFQREHKVVFIGTCLGFIPHAEGVARLGVSMGNLNYCTGVWRRRDGAACTAERLGKRSKPEGLNGDIGIRIAGKRIAVIASTR